MPRTSTAAGASRLLKCLPVFLTCMALAACGSGGGGAEAVLETPAAAGPASETPPSGTTPAAGAPNPLSPSSANAAPAGTGNATPSNTPAPVVGGATVTSDSNPGAAAPADGSAQDAGLRLLAGTIGGPGTLDGTGAAARFYGPSGAALDADGNLYIADTDNHAIRRVSTTGEVQTVAGSAGVAGTADGAGGEGGAARFAFPRGMAFDAAGNLYIADTGNHAIRKMSPAGAVSTLAGSPGQAGNADGTGSAARFHSPTGIALDAAGNLYVTDTDNGRIRQVTPGGQVSTLAGIDGADADTMPDAVSLRGPRGIARDAAGNLYVTVSEAYKAPLGSRQFLGSAVVRITPAGEVATLAGDTAATGSADGQGGAARFDHPSGIALDAAGTLFVADMQNNTLRKITPDGAVSTLAGLAASQQAGCGSADGSVAQARFCHPADLAVDAAGNLYVADASNGTVRRVTPAGQVTTLAGLAAVYGSVDGTGFAARFNTPNGIARDSAGNLYVADLFNGIIRKITPAGAVSTLAGRAGAFEHVDGVGDAAQFAYPVGITADTADNLYVTEEIGRTVRKITPGGAVSTLAGRAGEAGNVDGQGSAALFNFPFGITADATGNLYLVDEGNCNIRAITPAGVTSTVAGSTCGNADGPAASARFNFPFGITRDAAGNLYVADTYNNTIRKITPEGIVSTLAGLAGTAGSADGQGAAARFNSPAGMAVDSAGNVYVADTLNNAIRRITPAGMVSTVAGVAGRRGIVLGGLPGGLSWPRGIALLNDKELVITTGNGVLQLSLP